MKLFLVHRPTVLASVSPYRLLDEQGQEIAWANAFLDGQHIRQLSLRSLRAYAYDLLHFARWWSEPPLPLPLSEITESTLLDYVRHQLDQDPKPTPQTVNHRLTVIRCLYRFHHGQEIPRRQFPFPAHLYDPLPARLWPSPSRHCLRYPPQTTAPRHPASVRRASRSVLGELSYLPRSCHGGIDVTRWPAFLRDPDAPTRRSETGRCAATRSGQGPQTAHLAAARRDHGSASKLPSPGTAANQLPISVRFVKRPSAWSAYDAGRTPLAIPPPSIAKSSPNC